MRNSIRVKILVFPLRKKNIERGTRKEEGEKHWNNGTLKHLNEEIRQGGTTLLQIFMINSSINASKFLFFIPHSPRL